MFFRVLAKGDDAWVLPPIEDLPDRTLAALEAEPLDAAGPSRPYDL